MNQKGLSLILIIVGIGIVGTLVGGVYYLGKFQTLKPQSQNPVISQTTPMPSPTPDEIANWKTFRSTNGRYSIKYPSDIITLFSPEDAKGDVLFVLTKDKNVIKYAFWPISLSILWRGNPGASAEQALFRELNYCILPCNKKDQEVPVRINNAVGFASKDLKEDYYLTNTDQTSPVFRVTFSYQAGKYTDASNEVKIFRQMLSTFKFTN